MSVILLFKWRQLISFDIFFSINQRNIIISINQKRRAKKNSKIWGDKIRKIIEFNNCDSVEENFDFFPIEIHVSATYSLIFLQKHWTWFRFWIFMNVSLWTCEFNWLILINFLFDCANGRLNCQWNQIFGQSFFMLKNFWCSGYERT